MGTKEKRKFYNERFYELGNVIVFHLSLCLWNVVGIFQAHPTLFMSTAAFTFAHLIHRLIICDVTKQKSRKIQYIIIPYVVIGILSVLESFFQIKIFNRLSMKDFNVMLIVLLYSVYVMFV